MGAPVRVVSRPGGWAGAATHDRRESEFMSALQMDILRRMASQDRSCVSGVLRYGPGRAGPMVIKTGPLGHDNPNSSHPNGKKGSSPSTRRWLGCPSESKTHLDRPLISNGEGSPGH